MTDSRSRSTTQDSEDVALYNGSKTLEEVVARLNDLENNGTGRRSSGKGLISVDQFPFLRNLFHAANANTIVVDEGDANLENNPIADIFLWRFPLVSTIWFVVLQLIFFLHIFCDYSLLTIMSLVALWQLLVDFLLVTVVPFAQKIGLFSEDIQIKDTLRKTTLFNTQVLKIVGAAAYEISDMAIGMWRMTVLEANMARVLVVFRFVLVVLIRSFSVPMTLWLILMAFFTVPVSYSRNRLFADVVVDGASDAASRKSFSIISFTRNLESAAFQSYRANYDEKKKADAFFWKIMFHLATNLNWLTEKLLG